MTTSQPAAVPTPACPREPRSRRLLGVLCLSVVFALAVTPAAAQVVETTRLDPEEDVSLDAHVAPAPGVGFVAAWARGRIVSGAFGHSNVVPELAVVAWYGPEGESLTPLRPLDTREDDVLRPVALASAAPGEAVVALLVGPHDDLTVETQRVALDGSQGEPHAAGDCPASGEVELVAVTDGYWLVWLESCPGSSANTARARRIDRSGEPAGEAITVAGPGEEPERIDAAGVPGDGFWVAWTTNGERVLRARRFLPGGAPATPGVDVRLRPLGFPQVAALPDGTALVAWEESQDVLVRRLDADGSLAGPPANLGAPGLLDYGPRVALTSGGVAAALWCRRDTVNEPSSTLLRVFDLGDPSDGLERRLDTSCDLQDELAFGPAGTLLVTAHETVPSGPLVLDQSYSRPRIGVLRAGDLVPPPGPGFVPNAFPGFRLWVRIGGDEPAPRIGVPESFCLPETACVSGSLPGRIEVLLRIVGPKPNGYLWPTVVRFTTSTVEVWIEQLSTGTRRYYRLSGAAPGTDDLTGSFDRNGFLP